MEKSKFEIRKSKYLARDARECSLAAARKSGFEFLISNFEFPPHAALV